MKKPRRQVANTHPDLKSIWAASLQSALESVVSGGRERGKATPRSTVIDVSSSGNRFEIELRFVRGEQYCCMEPGCFVAGYARAWWQRFRAALAEVSDRDPPPMTISVRGVFERGAIFAVKSQEGLESPTAEEQLLSNDSARRMQGSWLGQTLSFDRQNARQIAHDWRPAISCVGGGVHLPAGGAEVDAAGVHGACIPGHFVSQPN